MGVGKAIRRFCCLHDLPHWGQGPDSTGKREGEGSLMGMLGMGPGWVGQAGYRSGGSEQGSSAYTTSRECSRARELSTRKAAHRGLPSARLGTCASSPSTRACTWYGEADVSDQASWTPGHYSVSPLVCAA